VEDNDTCNSGDTESGTLDFSVTILGWNRAPEWSYKLVEKEVKLYEEDSIYLPSYSDEDGDDKHTFSFI